MTIAFGLPHASGVHVLVTGFEPFGGFAHNPSEAAVRALPDRIDNIPVRRAVLPVVADTVARALDPLWRAHPSIVIHTGLAERRRALSIEQVAVNRLAFECPDNAGCVKKDAKILVGGPPTLPGRIDPVSVVKTWKAAGLAGRTSTSAGEFLCNQTFYLSLYHLPETTAVGFVHVPPDETLAPRAAHLVLTEQIRAIVLVIQTAIRQLQLGPDEETRA